MLKRFITFLCISLWPLLLYAGDNSKFCVFLGSHPSLIVKFKNISSYQQPSLKPEFIQRLSSPHAIFSSARPMSGDAYILFFSPEKAMQAAQINPGCYSQSSINELIHILKTKANIEYADPNILMTIAQTKKSSVIPIIDPIQWNLLAPPGGIDAQTAFNNTTGNINAITAVLDTGVLNNDSLNPNVLPGVTFNDNGGSFTTGAAPSCDSSCSGYDHGTHVAGTVSTSGVLAYGQTIYGVAPTSHILPINVFTKFTDNIICTLSGLSAPCLLSYTADQVNALSWLNGESFVGLPTADYITTVNMSLGGLGSCGAALQQAINNLLATDISFSISAGNSNADASLFTPANCSGVMPVAATGPAGYGTPYSNYGNIVSFAAPGGDSTGGIVDEIYSTIENGYGYLQGTSMASPHVAGLSSLLYSVDPTLTPAKVLNIIQTTTTPFPAGGPGDSCTITKPCGTGIIDAATAVIAAFIQAPVLTWSDNLTITPHGVTQATISWNAASWNPSRSTTIVYTVNNNGNDVLKCTGITALSCTLTNLIPNTNYTVFTTATDYRNIYPPLQTSSKQFILNVIPPSLTVAARNPLKPSMAFIYYDSIGNDIADSYTINGLPDGATVSLDSKNNRFTVVNITTPKKVDHVTITGNYNSVLIESNEISIPNIL